MGKNLTLETRSSEKFDISMGQINKYMYQDGKSEARFGMSRTQVAKSFAQETKCSEKFVLRFGQGLQIVVVWCCNLLKIICNKFGFAVGV